MPGKLQIRMLGEFSLTYGDHSINDRENRSKKVWTLLAYMICFRNREITQQELIDLLWSNDSSDNPANALKTMFHRVRSSLDNLKYAGGHKMIVSRHGSYAWNNELDFTVDVDEFEELVHQAKAIGITPEQKLALYRRAVALYNGDFLPKYNTESWVIPINVYYHMMFLQIAHEMIGLLSELHLYDEIAAVCSKAVEVDPYDEDLYYYLIKALVDSGNQQAAMRQYEKMTELFYHKFGVTPNNDLTALYREVVKTTNSMETDLNIIKDHLREADAVEGAFFCEYEFFKDIYRIEARAAARNGSAIHIGLLTVSRAQGNNKLPLRSLNAVMGKLRECIRVSLRKGDVFALYSVSQYIIMLPHASYEDSQMALNRIIKRYNRENPRSTAKLSMAIQPLEPIMF